MKLKSLILGSVAAAGLSTAGFAADLGVMTSLDVCDSLGLSGLTISSDTNCLQISGGVAYEFNWGNFNGNTIITHTNIGRAAVAGAGRPIAGNGADEYDRFDDLNGNDWNSKVEAWLKFVGTSSTDVGPASVTIKLKGVTQTVATDGAAVLGGDDQPFKIDQAYVQVGSDTVLMIGKKDSIANFDSQVYNFTTLFNYDKTDPGTYYDQDVGDNSGFGGHSIQVVANVADGVKAGIGLEDINDLTAKNAGTLVGVVTYVGENVKAHGTVFAAGILDGTVDAYGAHIGAQGTFGQFSLAGAFGYHYNVALSQTDWAATLSAQAKLDMFKIAGSFEATGGSGINTDYGFGGSIGAKVTDTVEFNLGGKYFQSNNGQPNAYHIAAQAKAAITETIALTAEVGVFGNNNPTSDFYAAGNLAWTPDTTAGGFTTSLNAEIHQNGGYKLTVKASKTFQ